MSNKKEYSLLEVIILLKTNERMKRAFVCLFLSLCLLLAQFLSFPIPLASHAAELSEPIEAQTVSISNPHKGYQYNYKGNLHAHSSNVDGADSPTTVGQWYRDNSYDFYAITDHDYLTLNPNVSGILWMGSGEEDSHDGSSGHMNHINITSPISSGTDQQRIDNVQNQGGRSILNHPAAPGKGWSAATIVTLEGVMGMEICPLCTGIWDSVLDSGKTVWAIATDDSHKTSDRGRGWVIVNSSNPSPTKEEIFSQMASGNFYASRGFDLSITTSGDTISANTTNGSQIRWIKKSGQVIKTTSTKSDSYAVDGLEGYVRVEILDGYGVAKAWSQPLTVFMTHPNGCLVKESSSPKIHLLEEGKKRWIASASAFESHGFSFGDVITVTSEELASYTEGNTIKARIGTLIKTGNSPPIYVVDQEGTTYYKRWITSAAVFTGLGLKWENTNVLSDQEVEDYTTSSPVTSTSTHPNGCLVKSSSSPKVYLLEDEKRKWIESLFAFSSHGFKEGDIITISQNELDSYPADETLKARIGTLIRPENERKVYIVEYQAGTYYKRWITSGQVFTGLGLKWHNIRVISSSEKNGYQQGDNVDRLP